MVNQFPSVTRDHLGWRLCEQVLGLASPFFLVALLATAGAVVVSCAVQIPREGHASSAEDDVGGFGPLLSIAGVRPSLLSVVGTNALVGMLEPLVPLRLAGEPWNLGVRDQGLVFGTATLAYLLSTPAAGVLADRWPKGRLIGFGLVCAGAGALATGLPRSWGLAPMFAGLVCLGVGTGLVGTPTLPLLAGLVEASPVSSMSMVFAAQDTATSLGFVIGPLLAAVASETAKVYPGFVVGAAVMALGFPVTCYLSKAEASLKINGELKERLVEGYGSDVFGSDRGAALAD